MVNQSSDFYGALLLLVLAITMMGIFSKVPQTTGFVVKEIEEVNTFFDIQTFEGDPRVCADGSLNGECSTLLKPNFCVYGTLVEYCELCGCDAGEVCSNRECVKVTP